MKHGTLRKMPLILSRIFRKDSRRLLIYFRDFWITKKVFEADENVSESLSETKRDSVRLIAHLTHACVTLSRSVSDNLYLLA